MTFDFQPQFSTVQAVWTGCQDENEAYYQEQYAYPRSIELNGHDRYLNMNSMQNMSSMDHYMQRPDAPILSSMYTDPIRHQHLEGPYYQDHHMDVHAPWPSTAEDCQRQVSPDSSAFSSSPNTLAPEEMSPRIHIGPNSPGSSAEHLFLSYGHTHELDGYPSKWSIGGGDQVVALNQIQGVADAQEPSLEAESDELAYRMFHQLAYTKSEHYDQEPDFKYGPDREDSGVGDSIRDAESVVYTISEKESESEDDEDYSPRKKQAITRKRRGSQTSNRSASSKNQKSKRAATSGDTYTSAGRKRKRQAPAPNSKGAAKPFPCCFHNYGCELTFPTKNEWKRHVATQHIKANLWRCDLCPTQVTNDIESFNDFNRKDLFTQHLRRMHTKDSKNGNAPSKESGFPVVNDETIGKHQKRCHLELRKLPQHSSCLFCRAEFVGNNTWDERMEHVGKHLETDPSLGKDPSTWHKDARLENYLEEEGLIQRCHNGWELGDGMPRRDELEDENNDSDADADGEEDHDTPAH